VALDSKVSTELKQLSAEMEFMRYGLVSLSLLCFRSPFANLLKFWLNNAT
jgi:hypothetical protein